MNDRAKALVEEHYRLVEEIMQKYDMRESDTPDWHGALSMGLCIAAERWVEDADSEYKTAGFEDYAKPYMILAVCDERPVYAVYRKVKRMYSDLSPTQNEHICKLCFVNYCGPTTVDILAGSDEYVRLLYT